MIADHGYYVPAILDTDGAIADSYGVQAFPSEVFIDAQGVVVSGQIGSLSADELWATVAAMTPPTTTEAASATTVPPTSTSVSASLTTTTSLAPTTTEAPVTSTTVGASTTASGQPTSTSTAGEQEGSLAPVIFVGIAVLAVAVAAVVLVFLRWHRTRRRP